MNTEPNDWVVVQPGENAPGTDARVSVGAVPSDWTTVAPGGKNEEPAAPMSWGEYATRMATGAANWGSSGISNRFVAAKRMLTGEEPDYTTALQNLNKQQQQFEGDNPWAMVLPKTVTGLAGGGAAGALLREAVPALGAARTLLPRIGAGLVEGGILGGAAGVGHTYSGIPSDYIHNGIMGSILGAGIGGAAPVAGAAAGKVYRGVADSWPAVLRFAGRQAADIPPPMLNAAEADMAGIRSLRPGGMLPDAGPSMLGVAQGSVLGTGGPGKSVLVGALKDRDAATNRTITNQIDQTFGPAQTPSFVDRQIGERMGELSPAYEQVLRGAQPVETGPLAQSLDYQIGTLRGPAQAALRQIRGMLDVTDNPGVLDPRPRTLQSAREAVRGMLDGADVTDTNVRRVLTDAYRQMTRELQTQVPGIAQLDSQYAELGAQQRGMRGGSAGADIFDTGKSNVYRPNELTETMQGRPTGAMLPEKTATTPGTLGPVPEVEGGASAPKGLNIGPSAEGFRLQQMARAELERIVGTNKNDLAKLENLIGQPQDWNQQKLAIMFGQDRADQLMSVLQNARQQRDTYQKVWEGAQTATRLAAKEALEPPSAVKVPTGTRTIFGTLAQPVESWVNARRTGAALLQRDRIAQLMATRDPATIQDLANQMQNVTPTRNAREELIRRLTERAITASVPLAAPSVGR